MQKIQNYQITLIFPISPFSVQFSNFQYTEYAINFPYFSFKYFYPWFNINFQQINFLKIPLCMLYRKYNSINQLKMENAERDTEINGEERRDTLPHKYELR